jgi:hypothetical protein
MDYLCNFLNSTISEQQIQEMRDDILEQNIINSRQYRQNKQTEQTEQTEQTNKKLYFDNLA